MPTNTNNLLSKKRKAIKTCQRDYKLQGNAAIEEILGLDCLTEIPSKKLAFLIMAYKREVKTSDLRRISDQPAGLVKALRADGFLFKDDGRTPPSFVYKNDKGETCRKIIGFRQPKAKLKDKIESILEKSVAACVSAIEIYNKPDFKYREETFSILLVNAWELLLKAKILADNNGQIKSIHAIDQRTNKAKTNRSGNPMTIDVFGAIKELEASNAIDARCRGNIEMLIEIRDNAIHFVNKGDDLSKKVQEIGTAGLRNYVAAMAEWFSRDLSKYNFYLMPMSFFHPVDLDSFSVRSRDKEIEKMLDYFREIEKRLPYEEGNPYSISLLIKTKFIRSSEDSAFEVRFTNRSDAPEVRVTEESVIKQKYPLTYGKLVEILKGRYEDFLVNKKFHAIRSGLEDTGKHAERYCRVHRLNVLENSGSLMKFYSPEVIKEFDKYYTKKKS